MWPGNNNTPGLALKKLNKTQHYHFYFKNNYERDKYYSIFQKIKTGVTDLPKISLYNGKGVLYKSPTNWGHTESTHTVTDTQQRVRDGHQNTDEIKTSN